MENFREKMENTTLFLDIIAKKSPAKIIFEDDQVIAFFDKFPVSPGHFLVVPKKYSRNLFHISDEDLTYLIKIARKLALEQVKQLGATGFRLQVNNEKDAKQTIFHTHIHIIPFYKKEE
ncbi:HIT family protein [Mesomycoplasma ovipneumoniae]|uniref:HIT family protein n=2 Tax=Mesomycoplasma ovipneumoniae TaxID=29562 RepID=A0AAJ2PB35_9BACT|nr:HIT family protein [Mesomycoplasma ovipneumoniae]MDO4157602.1 HIT family protein [Mesomycoplasma ovipneumoniae]MDO4158689.1 HIT family protein [Mesomycoplasma ovipneumoniae]MDO6821988.1 HIT family protein [Mesomycoplasma ovipneumoniae]MDO6856094.1 HIT family protein [Mesomycoplasma ovipneumoniae]